MDPTATPVAVPTTAPPFSEEQLVWLRAVTGRPLAIPTVSIEGPHASGETLPPCSTTPTPTVMPGEQDIRVLTIVGNWSPLPYCSTSSPYHIAAGMEVRAMLRPAGIVKPKGNVVNSRGREICSWDRILRVNSPFLMWYIRPPLYGSDVSRLPVLLSMPTLTSGNPRLSTELDVLAAAAAASEQPNPQPGGVGHGSRSNALESSNQAGPFNPVASLPIKLVKRILNLEFVEMSELTVDDDTSQATGQPHPARLPVTTISQWLERFAVMVAIMVTRFPLKAPELFAYQAMIVRAQRGSIGLLTTGSLDGWHLPEGTLTGQSRTPSYTRRPSQAGHRPLHGAHTAWPMITVHSKF